MTRFVELPMVSERGSVIWVNPDHIVAVEASHSPGRSYLLAEQGHRPHIDLSQEAVVECLRSDPGHLGTVHGLGADEVDLRDSVRENLMR